MRLQITCSGSSILACSLILVSCPVPTLWAHLLTEPENRSSAWEWQEPRNQEVNIVVASASPKMRTNNYSILG